MGLPIFEAEALRVEIDMLALSLGWKQSEVNKICKFN